MYLSVARDFTPHPGPRYARQGAGSGEAFRKMLVEAFQKARRLIVDLDGTSGFGSSFLDEAFGGLIRSEGMTRDELTHRLVIKSDLDESYKSEIQEALELARPQ